MNRPQRNNNPGNLKYAKQRESTGKDAEGFATFPTPFAGWRALVRQIEMDQDRGDTVVKFISEYAPVKDNNNTLKYLSHVCDGLKAQVHDQLSLYSPYALAGLIAQWEGYFVKD